MNITREKVIALWGLINRLAGEKVSVKFHYVVLKNKLLIEPEVKTLQEAQQPPEGYQEFEKKRMDTCREFCEKEDGNPKLQAGNFVIPDEQKEKFDETIAALKEEYKETIATMESNREQFLELLKEEVPIDFVPIPFSILPDSLLGSDVELLFDLIEEGK